MNRAVAETPTTRVDLVVRAAAAAVEVAAGFQHPPGRPSAVALTAQVDALSCHDADGITREVARVSDELTWDDPVRTGRTTLTYRIPLPARTALLPVTGWLPWPLDHHAAVDRCTRVPSPDGSGLVVGTDPHGGLPTMVGWPPTDPPRLLMEVRNGEVGSGSGWLHTEVADIVDVLAAWLGPIPDVAIVDAHIVHAHAASYPGLVIVHPKLTAHPTLAAYQYLPHELSHQWFGNRVRFAGPGYLLGQECLPEALQALYGRLRRGRAFYELTVRQYGSSTGSGGLAALAAIDPPARAALGHDDYHRLLAAGTRWWLAAFDSDRKATMKAVRNLGAKAATVTGDRVAQILRTVIGPGGIL